MTTHPASKKASLASSRSQLGTRRSCSRPYAFGYLTPVRPSETSQRRPASSAS
jgi:hypothetical protein